MMKGSEGVIVVPLRREVLKAPRYQRTKKAVIATREFLQRFTGSDEVLLGRHLNERLQEGGRKNVPSRVKVRVVKDVVKGKDAFKAELEGFAITLEKEKKEEGKKEEKVKKEEVVKVDAPEVKEEKSMKEELLKETPQGEKARRDVSKEGVSKKVEQKLAKKEAFPKDEKPKHEKKK